MLHQKDSCRRAAIHFSCKLLRGDTKNNGKLGLRSVKAKQGWWWSLLFWGACVSPPVILLWMIAASAVDVPLNDQWEFVRVLEKDCTGLLDFQDLWQLHNEHRILFPRIVMLVLARLTGWNTLYEIYVGALLGILIFLTLAHQAHNTFKQLELKGLNWAIPIISVLVFSLTQIENWLWGWQIQMLLNVLTVAMGIVLLSAPASNWRHFTLAVLSCVVASYSFANGLLCWPIGLAVILLVRREKGGRLMQRRIGIWLIASIFTTIFYFLGYEQPLQHPSVWLVFKEPLIYAGYVLAYLGGPVRELDYRLVIAAGASALSVWLGTLYLILRSDKRKLSNLAPYIGLGLYAIGSAMITGAGRMGFGIDQAISSRYVVISNLLWAADVMLLVIVVSSASTMTNRLRASAISGLAIAVVMLIFCSVHTAPQYGVRRQVLLMLRAELASSGAFTSPAKHQRLMQMLYPDPLTLEARATILKKYHLSVYRDK